MKRLPTYEQLCKQELLRSAWQEVQSKGAQGGVDNVGVKEFAFMAQRELEALSEELSVKTYLPQPYLQIHIPKDETEFRKLGLLTIRDKIVQTAGSGQGGGNDVAEGREIQDRQRAAG